MRTANKNEYSMSIQEAMDMTGMSRNFIINAVEQGKWPGTVITVKGRRTVHSAMCRQKSASLYFLNDGAKR